MSAEDVAGYDDLLPVQQVYFDHLMKRPMGQWPDSLKDYYNSIRPRCGDEIADTVGRWVKMQRD